MKARRYLSVVSLSVMAALLVVLSTLTTSAADKIVGAVWLVKFGSKDKSSQVRLRATPDGKVYDFGSEEIGSWKGDNAKVTMKVTGCKGRQEAFNGTYVLTNISKEPPPRWSGKWTPPGGSKSKNVQVRLLKD